MSLERLAAKIVQGEPHDTIDLIFLLVPQCSVRFRRTNTCVFYIYIKIYNSTPSVSLKLSLAAKVVLGQPHERIDMFLLRVSMFS